MSEIALVLGKLRKPILRDQAEHFNGIVINGFPELTIEAAKEFDRVGVPHPPEVAGHFHQRLEAAGTSGETWNVRKRGKLASAMESS